MDDKSHPQEPCLPILGGLAPTTIPLSITPTNRDQVMLLLVDPAEPLVQLIRRLRVADIPSAAHDVKGAMDTLRDVIDLHLDLHQPMVGRTIKVGL